MTGFSWLTKIKDVRVLREPLFILVVTSYTGYIIFVGVWDKVHSVKAEPVLTSPATPAFDFRSEMIALETKLHGYTDDKVKMNQEIFIAKLETLSAKVTDLTGVVGQQVEATRILSNRIFEMQRDNNHRRNAVYSF